MISLPLLDDKSSIFRNANPYTVSEYVRAHVGSHDLRLRGTGDARASLAHRDFGDIGLCRLSYGREARVISDGLDDTFHFQFVLNGECRYQINHEMRCLTAGQLLVINPNDPIDLTYSEDCEKFILRMPSRVLVESCQEHQWTLPRAGIRFDTMQYQFGHLAGLVGLLSLICQEAESGAMTPQVLRHYHRLVAAKLMTSIRHNVTLQTQSPENHTFERISRFIEARLKEDIGLEDLVNHTRLSKRSIYLLFEKQVQTSPMNYIRRRKLEAVHQALLNQPSKCQNVTGIALDFGFSHLGRFSNSYRDLFGVLPSETLKEAQRQLTH